MKKNSIFNTKGAFPYIMILPTLAIILIFMLYPIGNTFYLSTQNYVLTDLKDTGFIGLDNFKTLLQDEIFWKAARNSIVWTVTNVGIQVVLGLIVALLLNMEFKGRGIFRALMFTPWAVGGILVALMFGFMFNESIGVIGDLLMKFGIVDQKISWFSSGTSSMLVVIIANTWRGVPFFAISILSSLQTIPLEVYESADVDGASSWRKFSRITMPLIKDTLLLTTLLRTIWTLNVVDIIYGMTNGGPNFSTLTIPVYIMKVFNDSFNMGYASALAVIMVIILMIFSAVYLKLGKYGEEEYY
jgi:multiple sugar transport system permease protein